MPGRRVSRNRKMNRKRSKRVSRRSVNKSVRSKRRTRRSRRSKRIVRKSLRGGSKYGNTKLNQRKNSTFKPMLEETSNYIMGMKNLDHDAKTKLIGKIAKTVGKQEVNDIQIARIVEEQYIKWKKSGWGKKKKKKDPSQIDKMIHEVTTKINNYIMEKTLAEAQREPTGYGEEGGPPAVDAPSNAVPDETKREAPAAASKAGGSGGGDSEATGQMDGLFYRPIYAERKPEHAHYEQIPYAEPQYASIDNIKREGVTANPPSRKMGTAPLNVAVGAQGAALGDQVHGIGMGEGGEAIFGYLPHSSTA